jgi:hypothetical protein
MGALHRSAIGSVEASDEFLNSAALNETFSASFLVISNRPSGCGVGPLEPIGKLLPRGTLPVRPFGMTTPGS